MAPASEAVLQAGMAELVRRPGGAQDVPLVCVIEEVHQLHRSMPSPGELSRGERCRPGLWDSESGHECGPDPEHRAEYEPGRSPAPDPVNDPDADSDDDPNHQPDLHCMPSVIAP
jgi:hypothetical protein